LLESTAYGDTVCGVTVREVWDLAEPGVCRVVKRSMSAHHQRDDGPDDDDDRGQGHEQPP